MGQSGNDPACLGNPSPDWTILDTGLYCVFYRLIYVSDRSTMCHNGPPLETIDDASMVPFACLCGAAQPIRSLTIVCLYVVCQKCRDLCGESSQHSRCHGHTLTALHQACH
jgi:hypothetical protein